MSVMSRRAMGTMYRGNVVSTQMLYPLFFTMDETRVSDLSSIVGGSTTETDP